MIDNQHSHASSSVAPGSDAARLPWLVPAVIALLVFVAVVSAIDPAGDYPGMPQGPGLTTDEMFNVEQGVRLVYALPELIVGRLTLREVFGDANDRLGDPLMRPQGAAAAIGFHNPDHPPLGRLLIGLGHNVTRALFPPRTIAAIEPPAAEGRAAPRIATVCARTAPAAAFAALLLLVGWFTTCWHGRTAGALAALSLLLMPRLFGHAHLASLESFINLTYVAAVLCAAHWWNTPGMGTLFQSARPPAAPQVKGTGPLKEGASPSASPCRWQIAALTGVVFGLALLTKIQAILLPLPIALWAIWHWRTRAVVPLAVWLLCGLAVFFIGWPWLWLSPIDHLLEYFGRTTERGTLYVFYFGERYADVAVPWHYPLVMFLLTVPIGLHLLGVAGLFSERRNRFSPRDQLLLACLVFPLAVFAVPGVAVYDGARLFLVVFPLWAVFIGRGGAAVIDWLRGKWRARIAVPVFALLIAAQGYGLWALHPCYLSYYNLLIGGLPGAERMGMEINYWGGGITRRLLRETADIVPAGSTIAFFPVPHPFVIDDLQRQSPILRGNRIQLQPWHNSATTRPRYVLLYRRRADPPGTPLIENPPPAARRLAVVERQGTILAGLYGFPEESEP